MIKHLNIRVSGTVQGVFFRAIAKELAANLGLFGFAENREDGSVYIEVEGEESRLDQFLSWCKKGPPSAVVERIEINQEQLKNFSEFSI